MDNSLHARGFGACRRSQISLVNDVGQFVGIILDTLGFVNLLHLTSKRTKIKEIEEDNWSGILEIQDEAYHEIGPEELDVLRSKQSTSPETCFVCVSDQGDTLGYLLAHPWNES